MNGPVVIRIAMRALYRNKGRSLLTALGIIIGIAAVIAVVAVGQGATVMIRAQINSMGNNLVMIFPGSQRTGGFRGGAGTQQNLTAEDGDAILRECAYVTAVTPWCEAAFRSCTGRTIGRRPFRGWGPATRRSAVGICKRGSSLPSPMSGPARASACWA